MIDNIIWFDAETTGLDPDVDSLHQITAIYKNKEFNVYITPTTPNRSPYPIPDVERVSRKKASDMFREFIEECYRDFDENDDHHNFTSIGNKFKFGGQNPTFDLGFLLKVPHIAATLKKYFLYKPLDLFSVAYAAQKSGCLPENNKLGLFHIFSELFPDENPNFHDSLEDVRATIACWNELLRRLNTQ